MSVDSVLVENEQNLLLHFVPPQCQSAIICTVRTWRNLVSETHILEEFDTVFGPTATYFVHVAEPSGEHHWRPCPHMVAAMVEKMDIRIEEGKKVIKEVQKENKSWQMICTIK